MPIYPARERWNGTGVARMVDRVLVGLFFFFYANDWRKGWAPGAWIAVAAEDGVYLKYRSFRNSSWSSDDEQVAFVPYVAVAAARIDKRT